MCLIVLLKTITCNEDIFYKEYHVLYRLVWSNRMWVYDFVNWNSCFFLLKKGKILKRKSNVKKSHGVGLINNGMVKEVLILLVKKNCLIQFKNCLPKPRRWKKKLNILDLSALKLKLKPFLHMVCNHHEEIKNKIKYLKRKIKMGITFGVFQTCLVSWNTSEMRWDEKVP